NSRTMRYDPGSGATTVFREGTNEANGLMFDADGRLYACEGGGRRVARYEPDGGTTVLADRLDGRRLNSPNDLAIDSRGRIWFSDPRYRGIDGMCLDVEGNIVATAGWEQSGPGGMIYVFSPRGRVLSTHPMPEPVKRPTNC